jgi:NAD+ diphosphatase
VAARAADAGRRRAGGAFAARRTRRISARRRLRDVEQASFLGIDGGRPAVVRLPLRDARCAPATPGPAQRRGALAGAGASIFAQARALLHWQARSASAAAAAARNEFVAAASRALPGCGGERYPRTDPAIIVAVSDGERLLLGRQASWPGEALLGAGRFLEPGRIARAGGRARSHGGGGRAHRYCEYLALAGRGPFPASLMPLSAPTPRAGRAAAATELQDARWLSGAEIRALVAAASCCCRRGCRFHAG